MRTSRLRTRVLLLLGLTLVPVAALTVWSNLEHRAEQHDRAAADALRMVRLIAQEQERRVDNARQLLTVLSRLEEVRALDGPTCSTLLEVIMQQSPGYANLGAADASGRIFCSALPLREPVSIADRPYFRMAIRTRAFAIGEYQIGRITRRPGINVGLPALDDAGRVRAVVFAAIDLGWLNRLVAAAQLPQGAVVTVVDRAGTVLVRHPDPEQWVGRRLGWFPVDARVLQFVGEATVETTGMDGVRRLYAAASLSPSHDGGALVTLGIPTAVAYASAERDLVVDLAILLALTLASLGLGWIGTTRFVSRPLEALIRATRRLSAGDLTARVNARDDSELGQLARAFDDMAAALHDRRRELEEALHAQRHTARRLQALHEIDKAVVRAASPPEMAEPAVRHLVELVPAHRAAVVLVNQATGDLEPIGAQPPDGLDAPAGARVPLAHLPRSDAVIAGLRRNELVVLSREELASAGRFFAPTAAAGDTVALLPLRVGDDLIGMLVLWVQESLTPEVVTVVREVADQLAIGIHAHQVRAALARQTALLARTVEERTAQLRSAEDRLTAVLRAVPVALYSMTLARGEQGYTAAAIWVTDNVRIVTGWPAEAFRQDPRFWIERIHPEDRTRALRTIDHVHDGTVLSCEYRWRCADGQYRWFADQAVVVHDAEGRPAELVGSWWDITDRKTAEERAREARREAERANQAKSEFLSRMSHELRTPLNAILGFAQLLEAGDLSPADRESVGYILRAGRHLLDLITEVLDIASIESGHLRLRVEPVPVADLIADCLSLMAPLAHDAHVALEGPDEMDPDVRVLADAQRAKQIVLNLLSNGVKYTPAGGRVVLSVSLHDSGCVRLLVTDTGIGIPGDKLARLFRPFDRLGAERSGIEGTGLGLALSYRLAQAMGGRLGVRSAPGTGTTFWLDLPRAPSNAGTADADRPEARREAAGTTLLYVEDNLAGVDLLERILTLRPGVRLLTALQGGLALDLARKHRPDLILLDPHLPDLADEEVLRRLAGDERTRGIPVFLLGSEPDQARWARLAALGARGAVARPLDVHEVLRLLDEAAQGRRVPTPT